MAGCSCEMKPKHLRLTTERVNLDKPPHKNVQLHNRNNDTINGFEVHCI